MRLRPLIFLLITAFAAYSGFWYYLAHNAEDRVQNIARDLSRSGLEFDYQELAVSGFPYRLMLDFRGVEISYRDGPLQLDWSGPTLQAILQPWQPNHAVFLAPDSLVSASYRTEKTSAVIIEPGLASLSLRSTSRDGERYSLVLEDSRIQALASGADEAFLKRAEIHFRSRRRQAAGVTVSGLVEPVFAEVSVSLRNLDLDAGNAGPDGNKTTSIEMLAVDLLPRGRFFPRLTPYSLAAWRDAGSIVDIAKIEARWGEVDIEGDGSVSLDDELQPLGAISLRTANPEGMLDNMTRVGWIAGRDQQEAAQVVQLFRNLGAAGTPVTLSISVQGGSISMGPIVLAEISPLVPR